jgi:hypothetical protein
VQVLVKTNDIKFNRYTIFNLGSIPSIYRDLFEMINLHGIDKLTLAVFIPLFESKILSKIILNQV